MKTQLRLSILVLCFALLLALTGCGGTETVPPTTQSPADTVYAPAMETLKSAQNLTMDVTITTHSTVNGDEFSEQHTQTLTYQGLGTESLAIDADGELLYGIHDDTVESSPIGYHETYVDGTLYVQSYDTYLFCAAMDAEAASGRYVPAELLDGALYATVTAEETETGTKLTFTEPSAPEHWALPADAVLTDAKGTATVSSEGAITEMEYAVQYVYGGAEIQQTVACVPQAEANTVAAPENVGDYAALQDIDAVYLTIRGLNLLAQVDSVTTSSTESVFSQAANYLRSQTTRIHLSGRNAGTQAKVVTDISALDYNTMGTESYKQEESYISGSYTVTVNDGLPTSQSGVTWADMREYCLDGLLTHILLPDYWSDVVITDLGSVYLLEYTLNENFGNTMQNAISEMLWNDPSFLMNLASKYAQGEVKGYLSLDKYTGLSLAGGYDYQGTHTIDGQDYAMTMAFSQSVEAPAIGAHEEITGKQPTEIAPADKATPLMYHVTGENEQEMWLFGTIHVGDEATAYLPAEIREAFEASDALAVEFNTEEFEEKALTDPEILAAVSNAYYYTDGTTIQSLLSEEEYNRAMQLAKASGTYNASMALAKPYLWTNNIEMFYLRQGQSLHASKGADMRLLAWAKELKKPIREVESGLFQIEMLTDYSQELQLLLLREMLQTPGLEYMTESQNLYDLWCAGDEGALRELLSTTVNTEELTPEELAEYEANKDLLEEYNKAMSYDRNEGMLEVAKEYLESGDTVFYAVGLAHLLDDVNGLVDALREAGYTVEAVTYQ